jgi:hypothetical protein
LTRTGDLTLKQDLKKWEWEVVESIHMSQGKVLGGIIWTLQWNFELHKIRDISRSAQRLLAPQIGPSSMELVTSVPKTELHQVCIAVWTNRSRHSFSNSPQPPKMNAKTVFKIGHSIFRHVRKHGIALFPLHGFSWNFVLRIFTKICRHTQLLLQLGKNYSHFTFRLRKFTLSLYDSTELSVRYDLTWDKQLTTCR